MPARALLAGLLALLAAAVGADASLAFTPGAAPCLYKSQFFDAAGLECRDCPAGFEVAPGGTACACPAGSVSSFAAPDAPTTDPQPLETCASCTAGGRAPSATGLYCVTCDPSSGTYAGGLGPAWTPAAFDAALGDCACEAGAANSVVVEADVHGAPFRDAAGALTKRCVPCPAGTVAASGKCATCAYPKVLKDGQCQCPETLPAGAKCHADEDSAAKLTRLSSVLEINLQGYDSLAFQNVYQAGAYQGASNLQNLKLFTDNLLDWGLECWDTGDRRACSGVANLCVLAMYSDTHPACKVYNKILAVRAAVQYHDTERVPAADWSFTMPWLLLAGSTPALLKEVNFEPSFDPAEAGSRVSFFASKYALDGAFLGYQDLTAQFQLCGSNSNDDAWLAFGTQYESKCAVTLADMARSSGGGAFYDLYFVDAAGKYYPVSGKVKNALRGGLAVNANAAEADDLLVRRFFMFDDRAGVADDGKLKLAQVARTVKLVLPAVKGNKLMPPYAELEYVAIPAEDASLHTVSFEVAYTLDQADFWSTVDIILVAALAVGGFAWMQQTYNFMRRRQDSPMDMKAMGIVLANGAGIVGNAFFAILFFVSCYCFFFYKFQNDVRAITPADEAIGLLKLLLEVGAILKSIDIAMTIYAQTSIDIFFIDWEKPRRVLRPGGAGEDSAPVSAWRSLFIANEWNEIQSRRMTNFDFTCLAVVFFLSGLHLDRLGDLHPDITDRGHKEYADSSILLRFALSSCLMLGVGLAQMIWIKVVQHRYFENPMELFVDLCFLAKISVVILSEDFSGYYIHGRNQMPFADTAIAQINKELLKEEEMNVAARGLISSSELKDLAENQTFEIFIPRSVREKYNATLLSRIQAAAFAQRMGAQQTLVRGAGEQGKSNDLEDQTLKAKREIELDFMDMVAEVENNPGTQVRVPGYMQQALGNAPEMLIGADKAVFVHDFFNNFSRVLFHGMELKLIIWNVMVFGAVDAVAKNSALAIAVTWCLDLFARQVREKVGQENLGKKALVDSHFLI